MYFLSTLPIMARHYRIRSAKDLILIRSEGEGTDAR